MKKIALYTLLIASFIMSGAFSSTALSQPIRLRDQHPLSIFHLRATPDTARIAPALESEIRLASNWSNTLNFEEDVLLLDSESLLFDLEFTKSLSDSTELRATLPMLWRGGGLMDSPIDRWHRFFGFSRGDRENIENNQFNISGLTEDSDDFDVDKKGWGISNFQLSLKQSIWQESKSAFSLHGTLSLPSASTNYGHHGVEALLGGIYSRDFETWSMHVGGGSIYFSDTSLQGLRYERYHGYGFFNADYPITDRLSIQIGSIFQTSIVANVSDFKSATVYLDVGAVLQVGEQQTLEFLARENLFDSSITVDVSFLVGLKHRFSVQ